MASKTSALNERAIPDSRSFWQAAFLAAELQLLKNKGRQSPEGLAHLAAEFADASLNELRRRYP